MINIAKLLKDAPKGMKLYSPLLGEVEFAEVMDTDYVPIRVMCGIISERFDKFGRYKGNEYPNAECLLFPSKDCRTWEGWKTPVEPKFKVGDWVACIDDEGDMATEKIVSFTRHKVLLVDTNGCHTEYPKSELNGYHLWTIEDAKDGDVLATDNIICIFKKLDKDGYYIISPCIYTVKDGLEVIDDEDDTIGSCGFKPATKEDRELLFRKMKEEGYTWDKKKKELCKIQPHYDIANFHAGMPVLVRWYNTGRWRYSLYSFYEEDSINPFDTVKGSFTQCIPYNNDTKHLLGTTDMCDERFINW